MVRRLSLVCFLAFSLLIVDSAHAGDRARRFFAPWGPCPRWIQATILVTGVAAAGILLFGGVQNPPPPAVPLTVEPTPNERLQKLTDEYVRARTGQIVQPKLPDAATRFSSPYTGRHFDRSLVDSLEGLDDKALVGELRRRGVGVIVVDSERGLPLAPEVAAMNEVLPEPALPSVLRELKAVHAVYPKSAGAYYAPQMPFPSHMPMATRPYPQSGLIIVDKAKAASIRATLAHYYAYHLFITATPNNERRSEFVFEEHSQSNIVVTEAAAKAVDALYFVRRQEQLWLLDEIDAVWFRIELSKQLGLPVDDSAMPELWTLVDKIKTSAGDTIDLDIVLANHAPLSELRKLRLIAVLETQITMLRARENLPAKR